MRFFIILITLIVGGVYFCRIKADNIAKNIIENEANYAAESK